MEKNQNSNKPIIWTVSITHLYKTFQEVSNEFAEIAEIVPVKMSFEEAVSYIRTATKSFIAMQLLQQVQTVRTLEIGSLFQSSP